MAIPSYLPQQANIKAYYNLSDENDGSANGYNLTNTNSVTFTAAKYGNGANFGSSNSNKCLSRATDNGITTGAFTMSLWVKLLAEIGSGSWGFNSHSDAGTYTAYFINYNYNSGTRQLSFIKNRNYVASTGETYNITLGTTNWYNIIYTYDSSANVRGYLNGSLVAGPTTRSGNGSTGGQDYYVIGANRGGDSGGGFTNYASALIDETVIWNVCLSVDEIARVYAGPSVCKGGIAIGSPWIF